MRSQFKKLLAVQASVTVLGTLVSLSVDPSKANAALLVGNTAGNNVVIFDEQTGRFGGEFIPQGTGGLTSPDDLTFGPNGDLFISSGGDNFGSILRFDGKTGEFLGRFDKGGKLFRPYGIAFGPDNNLYVSSFRTDEILRFNGATGEFIDVFASGKDPVTGKNQTGGLNGPNDLLFDADGNLYVTTQGTSADGLGGISFGFDSQVLRYNIFDATPTPSVFIEQPEPIFGFISFLGLAFGPKGDLFVSDFANNIRRYDVVTGSLVDTLNTNYTGVGSTSSNFTGNLAFAPDNTLFTVGFNYTQGNIGSILRFDGETGNPLPAPGETGAVFVADSSNLKRPIGIAYVPITVPEPAGVLGLLGIGATLLKLRRDRHSPS